MDLSNLARMMMDDASENNHPLDWANRLCQVAERLLEVGQPFGPRRFKDLAVEDRWVAAYAARAYGLLPQN